MMKCFRACLHVVELYVMVWQQDAAVFDEGLKDEGV
jgi:hypothetical protein